MLGFMDDNTVKRGLIDRLESILKSLHEIDSANGSEFQLSEWLPHVRMTDRIPIQFSDKQNLTKNRSR